jgi:hypothetical protein
VNQISGDRTAVDLSVINHGSLSAKAIGLYGVICYLQQHEGIEYPCIDDIEPLCAEGRTAVISGLKELRRFGIIPARPPHPDTRKPGYLYVFKKVERSEFKIGCSTQAVVRREQLRKKHGDLETVMCFPVSDMGGTETQLHQLFVFKHIEGEWFDLNSEDLKQIRDRVTNHCTQEVTECGDV